jgi:hypothetical protein|nr:MAG TPA_asm: baseplate wedge protein [Caudoviricetes sp.]
MAVIKVSDLPQKATLDSDDKIVGYSSTGGTSLLLGSAFKAIQTVAETAASNAAASESTVASEKSELESEIATAKTDISTAKMDAVSAITTAQTTATDAIASAKTTAVSAVNSAKSTALSDVSAQQTTSVTAVKSQGDTSVAAVQSAQITATDAITTAHTTAVSAVQAQEAASIQAIEADSVLAGYAKKDELSSLIAAAVAEAKLAAYPVGSIYCSIDSTDPGTLFGGTWVAIGAGRALVAAGGGFAVGSEGGSDTHILTVEEMPSHAHTAWTGEAGWHGHAARTDTANLTGSFNPGGLGITASGVCSLGAGKQPSNSGYATDSSIVNINASHMHNVGVDGAGNHTHTVGVGATGGGQAFSVRNPYIAVNMWRRTA